MLSKDNETNKKNVNDIIMELQEENKKLRQIIRKSIIYLGAVSEYCEDCVDEIRGGYET